MVFLTLIWLVTGLMFTGLTIFDVRSKSVDWAFADLVYFVWMYFILIMVMSCAGINLGSMIKPKPGFLIVYGFIMFFIVAIPMWLQNSTIRFTTHHSKEDLR